MTKEQLLAFIQRILANCQSIEGAPMNRERAGRGQLGELRNILQLQNIPHDVMDILDDAIGSSYVEIESLAKRNELTREQLDIQHRRKIQRDREEMERNQYRGCR